MRRPQSAKVQPLSAGKTKEALSGQKYKQLDKNQNHHPKAKTIQIKVQQNKQENSDENQMINSQLFQRKKSEHFNLISSFQHKMKLQQNEIEVFKQQVLLQQRFLNTMSIQQQPDVQQYENEIIRLRSLLDEALLMPSEPKKNQLITYLAKIQELKNDLQKLKQITDNQQRDIQQLQNTIKKQQEYLHQNNEQMKSGRKQQEGQGDFNQLEHSFNQQMLEKERKIAELTASINKASKNFQTKINQQSQFIEQLNVQIQAKQNVIKQLEDENENLKSELGYLEDQQKESQTLIDQLQQQMNENTHISKKSLSYSKVQILFQYDKQVKQLVVVQNSSQTRDCPLSIVQLSNQSFYSKIIRKDCENQTEPQPQIEIHQQPENMQQQDQEQKPILFQEDEEENQTLTQVQPQKSKIQFLDQPEGKTEYIQDTDQIVQEIVGSYLQCFVDQYEYQINQKEQIMILAVEMTNEYLNSFIGNPYQEDEFEQDHFIKQMVDQYLDDILTIYN